jgi:hypothetical protein
VAEVVFRAEPHQTRPNADDSLTTWPVSAANVLASKFANDRCVGAAIASTEKKDFDEQSG